MFNASRKPVPKTTSMPREYTYFGERVCSDISGPYPETPQGYKYAINFYDCASKVTAVYFMKDADGDELVLTLKTFQSDFKDVLRDGAVSEWYSDNGQPFTCKKIEEYCAEVGTKRQFSTPYSPTRNANAERSWYTLKRPTRQMMCHRGNDTVAQQLWPYAMTQACSIHNSLPSQQTLRALDPLWP